MIKGVLIYDSKRGMSIYHNNPTNDIRINHYLLAAFIHSIRAIEKLDNPLIKNNINNLPLEQFLISFNENGSLEIIDTTGKHNKIIFHDYKDYSGVFSVDEKVDKSLTNELFKSIANEIDKEYNAYTGIKPELRKKLDDMILSYCMR